MWDLHRQTDHWKDALPLLIRKIMPQVCYANKKVCGFSANFYDEIKQIYNRNTMRWLCIQAYMKPGDSEEEEIEARFLQ